MDNNIAIPVDDTNQKTIDHMKEFKNNNLYSSENKSMADNTKRENKIENKPSFNSNSIYDNVLLEELYNSKEKNWRMDINSKTPNEQNENKKKKYFSNENYSYDTKNNNNNINNIEAKHLENNNKDINKIDRFKDFEDILNLEDSKVKKRKSTEKKQKFLDEIITGKSDINDINNNIKEKFLKENTNNLSLIDQDLEKEEKCKKDEVIQWNKENKDFKLNTNINTKNFETILKEEEKENNINYNDNLDKIIDLDIMDNDINNKNKEKIHINKTRNNNQNIQNNFLNENTNTNTSNDNNKFTGINLEYSEDKKSNEEKNDFIKIDKDKQGIINNDNNLNNNINSIFNKNFKSNGSKSDEHIIKNNGSIHFIDVIYTPSDRKKINIYSTKENTSKNNKYKNIPKQNNSSSFFSNSVFSNIKRNTQNLKVSEYNDDSKSRDKEKKNLRKERLNINLKKKLIYESNTIHHIPLSKNYKINSQKNFFHYLLGEDDNKNANNKNKNNQKNNVLFNYSSNVNKDINSKLLNSFLPVRNIKKELELKNNTITEHELLKNIRINRIKRAINNINKNNSKRNKDLYFNIESLEKKYKDKERNTIDRTSNKIFEPENNFHITYSSKNKNLKNENQYMNSEKPMSNTNSFFPLYNNFFNGKTRKNTNRTNNKFIILNDDDFYFKNKKSISKNKDNNKNFFYKSCSTNKNRKKTCSYFFGNTDKDEFFKDKKTLNDSNQRKSSIATKQESYNNNDKNHEYQIIYNYNNDNYSFLSAFKKKYNGTGNNSSYNYFNNKNTNKSCFNCSSNRYKEINFQQYIEKKGDEILSGFDYKNYRLYKKGKTSVLPANPFSCIKI